MRNLREEIRERIDLVELVSEYVRLERAGKNYKALCPFHTERTPSFHVSPALNRFHCFGCGASGDVFTFLMRIEGLSFQEALRRLADRAGIELRADLSTSEPSDALERLRKILYASNFFYRQCLQRTFHAQQYLQERGLTKETIERFELGYAPDGWDHLVRFLQRHGFALEEAQQAGLIEAGRNGYYDRFRNRIMFPIHDPSGRVIAFGGRILGEGEPKYLNSPETPLFEKRRVLYGWWQARSAILRERTALLVEGYLDLMMLHQYGLTHAVATLGTAFTEEHANRLRRLVERVYLLFDSDAAGVKASLSAGEILMRMGIPTFVVSLPEGDDPDSLLRREGASGLQPFLARATPFALFGLEQVIQRYLRSAGVNDPLDLDPFMRTELLKEALQWVVRLLNPLDQTACLQVLAPLSPAYLTSPQAGMESLQQELRRLQRRSAGQRRSSTPVSQQEPESPSANLPAVPKAVIEAEQALLRALLNPETAPLALEPIRRVVWSLPQHAQLAEWLMSLPHPPSERELTQLLNQLPDESLEPLLTQLLMNPLPPPNAHEIEEYVRYLQKRIKRQRRQQLAVQLRKAPADEKTLQEYWQLRVEHD